MLARTRLANIATWRMSAPDDMATDGGSTGSDTGSPFDADPSTAPPTLHRPAMTSPAPAVPHDHLSGQLHVAGRRPRADPAKPSCTTIVALGLTLKTLSCRFRSGIPNCGGCRPDGTMARTDRPAPAPANGRCKDQHRGEFIGPRWSIRQFGRVQSWVRGSRRDWGMIDAKQVIKAVRRSWRLMLALAVVGGLVAVLLPVTAPQGQGQALSVGGHSRGGGGADRWRVREALGVHEQHPVLGQQGEREGSRPSRPPGSPRSVRASCRR